MRLLIGILLICSVKSLSANPVDSSASWFPGGDDGFYKYLEDRLMAQGSGRPTIDQNGETVYFEISISDSGYVDSVRLGTCFNYQLCYQLRQILLTLPRVNPDFENGKTQPSRRIYALDFKLFGNGYIVDPAIVTQHYTQTSSSTLRWFAVVIAAVGTFLILFK